MNSKQNAPTQIKSQLRSSAQLLPANGHPNQDADNAAYNDQGPAYMTTAAAAKLLGLSMATVQKLVDKNILQAWKTFGGHRRISLASVLSYQNNNNFTRFSRNDSHTSLKMMLVIGSECSEKLSPEEKMNWDLPILTTYFDSLMEAMLELSTEKYDLLVMQLCTPRHQQEKTMEVLQKLMRSRQTVGHALILTTELNLLAAPEPGDAPVSIQILNQSLSPKWLSAYLSGFGSQQRN